MTTLNKNQRQAEAEARNIYTVEHKVGIHHREARNGHKSGVLWFTGLSGSGKSTLAIEAEKHLHRKGFQVYVLDGDNVRSGLNKDLGFSEQDRVENIRRVSELAYLFADSGKIVITAFISPYQADREAARAINGERFHEVFVEADLETCELRDPKGLYKRARAGQIPQFTGISAPYEPPVEPELIIRTGQEQLDASLGKLLEYIERNFGLDEGLLAASQVA